MIAWIAWVADCLESSFVSGACSASRALSHDTPEAYCAILQESCCQGEHTYLHAQLMLTQLARLPGGARFRRLSQELELHAAKPQGHVVWQMHFW